MDTTMNSEPGSAEAVFEAALQLPTGERDAFVSGKCESNLALLAEVHALLDAHDAAPTGFLGEPAAEGIAGDEIDVTVRTAPTQRPRTTGGGTGGGTGANTYTEKEGDTIGPYKLLQKLGEGGFGVVWMAEQSEPITRMVALKVIKAGMDTKEVLARFEAERQAVALMDHPNIAKVLDAGATSSGRPFFAMELVKGIPITKFCDQARLSIEDT